MVSFPIISGVVASSIHVLSGPDHLAAVTPMVVESEKNAWRIGLSWGLGHVTGIMIIGILVYLFREAIPFETISGYGEKFVGIILIMIGLWVLAKFIQTKKNKTVRVNKTKSGIRKSNIFHDFTYGVGVVHGMAGVSHLILLLPVLSFNSSEDAFIYIVGFCLGSIVSMIMYTMVLRFFIIKAMHRNYPFLAGGIQFSAAIFALSVGFYWVIQTL